MFIRASRETHSGELILKIRPNGRYYKSFMLLFAIKGSTKIKLFKAKVFKGLNDFNAVIVMKQGFLIH